jgi:hypothetical protein
MRIMILFDGYEYSKIQSEGVSAKAILEAHDECVYLDDAETEEAADRKIQRHRERHKGFWF